MKNSKINISDQAIRPPEAPRPSKDHSTAYSNRRTLKRDGIIPVSVSLAVKEELRSRLVLGWNLRSSNTARNDSFALVSSNNVMSNEVISNSKFPANNRNRDPKFFNQVPDSSSINNHKMLFNEGISDGGSIFTLPKGYGEEQFEISDKNEKHATERVTTDNPWWSISASSSIVKNEHQSTQGIIVPQRLGSNNNKTRRRSRERSLISRGANEIGNMVGPFLTAIGSVSRPNTTSLRPSQMDLSQMYYGSVMSTADHHDNSFALPLIITTNVNSTYENSSIASSNEKANPLKTAGMEVLAAAISAKGGAEFCYLQPSIDNAYSFTVRDTVPETIARNVYVTLGKEGILRSTELGGSEFVPHNVFQRDHDNYCKLRKLKLFGKFSLWKPLRAWRCYVIARKRRLVIATLNAKLFKLDSFYQSLLFQVVDFSIRLSNLQPLVLNEIDIYDIDQFVVAQSKYIDEFEQQKNFIVDEIAESLCKQSEMHILNVHVPKAIPMHLFNGRAGLSLEVRHHMNIADMSIPQQNMASLALSELSLNESFDNIAFQSSASEVDAAALNSLSRVGDESQHAFSKKIAMVSYTEKGAIRNACRRFATLLRLTDFILRRGLYICTENALMKFQTFLSNRVKKSSSNFSVDFSSSDSDTVNIVTVGRDSIPLIKIAVSMSSSFVSYFTGGKFIDSQYGLVKNKEFGANSRAVSPNNKIEELMLSKNIKFETVMQPDKEDIDDKIKQVIMKTRIGGSYMSHLTENSLCLPILEPIRAEIENSVATDLLRHRDSLQHLTDKICDIFSGDFDACSEYIVKYNDICDTYKKNISMFDSAEAHRLADLAPEAIVSSLLGFQENIAEAEAICGRQNLGSFRLEFSKFKVQVCRQAEACIALFSRLVPDLYVKSGENLYNDLNKLSNPLFADFSSLEDYVRVAEAYNKATNESDALSARFVYVMSLKEIIDKFKMSNSDAVVRQNITVFSAWTRFTQLLSDFEGILADSASVFKTELKNRAHALADIAARIKFALDAEYINNPDSEPENVLLSLGHLKIELDSVQQQAASILKYQVDLNYKVFNNSIVNEIVAELNSSVILWSVLKSIKELQVSYMAINFLDAASDDVEKQLALAIMTLNGLECKSDKVLQWLKTSIADLLSIVPVIKKLQSNTQKEMHTRRIHTVLNRQIFDDEDVTVGELVDIVKVRDFAEELHDIYVEAQFLYNLDSKVADVLRACASKEFTFKALAQNRSIVHIDNFDEIESFYEDSLLTVRFCVQSKFAKSSLRDFEAAHTKISNWIQINRSYKQVQSSFNRLRSMFYQAKTARYFSSSAKHFKVIEECWRAFSKLTKTEVRAAEIYSLPDIEEPINMCFAAATLAENAINAYIDDQCVKWPKLYLLDREFLWTIISTHEPHSTFLSCRILFPNLTDITFQQYEPLNAIAVHSMDETIEFKKACSARVSLVEWLTSINAAISERLESDIMKFVNDFQLLYEDLRSPKASEQSKICAIQIKFWRIILNHLVVPSRQSALNSLLIELKDQMSIFINNMSNYYLPYHIKSMSNLITVMIYHRELVTKLGSEVFEDEFTIPFFIESSIKKVLNIGGHSSVSVCQGQLKYDYGMHYFGFCDRLVVTPLTDKCFLFISLCMKNGEVPFLSGQHGVGKRSLVNYLTYELGKDTVTYDCGALGDMTSIVKYVRATLGCKNGVWLTISNAEVLSEQVYAELLSLLSFVQSALHCKNGSVDLAGTMAAVSNNPNAQPKICVIYNTISAVKSNYIGLSTSLRKQFRQLCIHRPPDIRKNIITVLLTANNFAVVPKICERICGLYDYLTNNNLVRESILFRAIIESIRHMSAMNTVSITTASLHSAALAKAIVSRIPYHLQKAVTESDLRFICNLFLEITYSREADLQDFTTSLRLNATEEKLVEFLQAEELSNTVSVVLFVGATNSGKSSIITEAIRVSMEENSRLIQRDTALQLSGDKSHDIKHRSKLHRVERIINPFLLSPASDIGDYPVTYDTAANEVINKLLTAAESNDETLVFHFDCHSSVLLNGVLSKLCTTTSKKAKVIWEISELDHIDPTTATSVPIIHLNEPKFGEEDTTRYFSDKLTARFGVAFEKIFENCTSEYVKPCSRNWDAVIKMKSNIAMIDSVFSLIYALLSSNGLQQSVIGATSTNKIKIELSIHRVFIFSCIWTYGVSASIDKDKFERWFLDYFKIDSNEDSNTTSRGVFPAVNRVPQLFEYYLAPVTDSLVFDMNWVLFDPGYKEQPSLFYSPGSTFGTKRSPVFESSLYYSAISTGSLPSYSVGILVPSATGAALSFIQKGLTSTGGNFLISGKRGSGKTSLVNEIIISCLARNSAEAASVEKNSSNGRVNWMCHVRDCSHSELMNHIEQFKDNLTPMIMERKLNESGIIIIEDLNISAVQRNDDFSYLSQSSCEFLRSSFENKEYYDVNRSMWRSSNQMCSIGVCDLPGDSLGFNARFIKNSLLYICNESSLVDIFSLKLRGIAPMLKEELVHDFNLLTFKTIGVLKDSLEALMGTQNRKKALDWTAKDTNFGKLIVKSSTSSIVDLMLSNLASTLTTMPAITPFEAIRVWDRLISDYCNKFPAISDLMMSSIETASNLNAAETYLFPAFAATVDKEMHSRRAMHSKILAEMSKDIKSSGGDVSAQPISYLRNANGFYKTGPLVATHLLTAEYLRDSFHKQFGSPDTSSAIDVKSLAYWTDVLYTATFLSPYSTCASKQILVLSSSHPEALLSVVDTAAKFLAVPLFVSLITDRDVEDQLLYQTLRDFSLSIHVLKYLKRELKQTLKGDILINPKSMSKIKAKYSSRFLALAEEINSHYQSTVIVEGDEDVVPLFSQHFHFGRDSLVSSKSCRFIIHTIELNADRIVDFFLCISSSLNLRINPNFKKVVASYITNLKIVLSFSLEEQQNEFFKYVDSAPGVASRIRYLPVYESLSSYKNKLENLFGREVATNISLLCQKYWRTFIGSPHTGTYFPPEQNDLSCFRYVDESLRLTISMYEMASQDKEWRSKFASLCRSSASESIARLFVSKAVSTSIDEGGVLEEHESELEGEKLQVLSIAIFNTICCKFIALSGLENSFQLASLLSDLAKELLQINIPLPLNHEVLLTPHYSAYLFTEQILLKNRSLGKTLRNMCVISRILPVENNTSFFLNCLILLLSNNCRIQILDTTLVSCLLLGKVLCASEGSSSIHASILPNDYPLLFEWTGDHDSDLTAHLLIRPTSQIPIDLSMLLIIQSGNLNYRQDWFIFMWRRITLLISENKDNDEVDVNHLSSVLSDFNALENDNIWKCSTDSIALKFRILYSIFYGLWLNMTTRTADFEVAQRSIIAYGTKLMDLMMSAIFKSSDIDGIWGPMQLIMSSVVDAFMKWLKMHKEPNDLWEIYITIVCGMTSSQDVDSLGYIFEWWKSTIGNSSGFLVEYTSLTGSDGQDSERYRLSDSAENFLQCSLKEIFKIYAQSTSELNLGLLLMPPEAKSGKALGRSSSHRSQSVLVSNKNRAVSINIEAESYAKGIISSIEANINEWLLWASDSRFNSRKTPPNYPTIIPTENHLVSLLEKMSISAVFKPSAAAYMMEDVLSVLCPLSPLVSFAEEVAASKSFPQFIVLSDPSNRCDLIRQFSSITTKKPSKVCSHLCLPPIHRVDIAALATSSLKPFPGFDDNSDVLHVKVEGTSFNLSEDFSNVLTTALVANESYSVKFVLLETDFVPFQSSALGNSLMKSHFQFPQLLSGRVQPDKYMSILENNYREISSQVPAAVGERVSFLNRVRWLLLIFHTSVECHVAMSVETRRSVLGIDTLCAVFDMIDSIYAADPATSDTSRRAIDISAVKAGQCPTNPRHIADYVVDCVYMSAVQSNAEKYTIDCIYKRLFSGKFYDCNEIHQIGDGIHIPCQFTLRRCTEVFKQISEHFSKVTGPVEFMGRSLPEENTIHRSVFRKAVQKVHAIWKETKSYHVSDESIVVDHQLKSSRFHFPISSPLFTRTKETMISIIRESFTKILTALPARIMTDSKEIHQQMDGHVNRFANSSSKRSPRMPQSSVSSSERRRANRVLTRYQSREFDPLWAFVLAESFDYNKIIDFLRRQLIAIDADADSVWLKRLWQQGSQGAHLDDVMLWLNHIRRGLVPSQWLAGRLPYTQNITIDEWISLLHERRKMISDWLVTGSPGVLKLSLLRSPSTLLHALKEKFSMSMENAVEKAHLKVSVLSPASISPALLKSLSDQELNFGCNILIGDAYLHNCTYNFSDDDDGSADILQAFSSTAFGQKVALQISAMDRRPEIFSDDYLCPVYVQSDLPPSELDFLTVSTTDAANASEKSAQRYERMNRNENSNYILKVPLLLNADPFEYNVNNIALHCVAHWRLPS